MAEAVAIEHGQLKQTRAATRLQRFVRRRTIRRVWYEVIEDFVGYHRLMRQLKQTRAAKVVFFSRHGRHLLGRIGWPSGYTHFLLT